MQLYTKTFAIAFAMRAATVFAESPDTCSMLTDVDSPFITSVAHLNGVSAKQLSQIPIADILAPVDENFPWFSKCVANINLSDIIVAMMSSPGVGKCLRDLEASSNLVFPDQFDFTDEYLRGNFCPSLVDIAIPCINDVFFPELSKALAKTGSCCSDLNGVIVSNFGANIQRLTAKLLKLLANAICSVKTTIVDSDGSGAPVDHSETCGYSLLTNFVGEAESDWELLMRLAAAVQIPEEEVCKAIEGEEFSTTTGRTVQFATVPGDEPYGICYNTAQNLVSFVKSFPVLRSLTIEVESDAPDSTPSRQYLSDIFSWGTCVRGNNFLRWIIDDDGIVMKTLEVLDALGSATSMHTTYTGVDFPSEEADPNEPLNAQQLNPSGSASTDGNTLGEDSPAFVTYDKYNSAEFTRAMLSQYVEPLASICIHFPSAKACSYESEKLKFLFGDVGRTVKASSTTTTPADKTNADTKNNDKV